MFKLNKKGNNQLEFCTSSDSKHDYALKGDNPVKVAFYFLNILFG